MRLGMGGVPISPLYGCGGFDRARRSNAKPKVLWHRLVHLGGTAEIR
jgi:hypothetical protein